MSGTAQRALIKRKQRSMVRVACNACRTRKIACTAERPRCVACSSTDRVCTYDTLGDGESRSAALKRENNHLRSEIARLGGTLDTLISLPEGQAPEYMAFLRSQRLQRSPVGSGDGESSPSPIHPPYSPQFKDESGLRSRRGLPRIAFDLDNVDMRLDDKPNIPFPQPLHESYYARLRGLRVNNWTTVPVSDDVAGFAISSYLAGRQDFFGYLDVDGFLNDLVAGRTRHCSPMLVNALLFRACQLPESAHLLSVAPSLSSSFFVAAMELANKVGVIDSRLTAAALLLLGTGCTIDGLTHEGLEFTQQGVNMKARMDALEKPTALMNFYSSGEGSSSGNGSGLELFGPGSQSS